MGIYVDPKNVLFAAARRDDIFVDKSGLIGFTNRIIGKNRNKICVTRPRRFGKSLALNMLSAYYSCNCESEALFQDLQIAQDPTFLEHLNKHHVIYMDVQSVWRDIGSVGKADQLIPYLQGKVVQELKETFPDIDLRDETIAGALKTIYNRDERNRFIILVDEWDVVVRDPKTSLDMKGNYISFLSSIFKGGDIECCIDMAYMTGILPIVKHIEGTENQSKLNNFIEYSMTSPGELAAFMGFTEPEVAVLCDQWNMPLREIKEWYDGYHLSEHGSIYCPESVIMALTRGELSNYWAGTSGFEIVQDYLRVRLRGLKSKVDALLANEPVKIDPTQFRNNVSVIKSVDDVLTPLVHYGYLSYDKDTNTVQIPNREVKGEFTNAIRTIDSEAYRKTWRIMDDSQQLLKDTWAGNEEKVAAQIQKVHNYKASPLLYNSEETLSSVIKLAYYFADAFYLVVPELPAGEGFADIAFIPYDSSKHIPMILELKWNQSAVTALDQIKNKNYQGRLAHYKKILLVGIAYEKGINKQSGKKHTCKIETWDNTK